MKIKMKENYKKK